MTIEITLFGFGDDCPAGFVNNKKQIDTPDAQNILEVLKLAGFVDFDGIALLVNGSGVAPPDWESKIIVTGDSIKVLSAIEGG
jgi:thiamine biosynthesis protein ThiS